MRHPSSGGKKTSSLDLLGRCGLQDVGVHTEAVIVPSCGRCVTAAVCVLNNVCVRRHGWKSGVTCAHQKQEGAFREAPTQRGLKLILQLLS